MMKKYLKYGMGVVVAIMLSGCEASSLIAGDNNNNDTLDTAGTFNVTGAEFEGSIGAGYDLLSIFQGNFDFTTDEEDWYKHSASADGFFTVKFQLESEASNNITVKLYQSNSDNTLETDTVLSPSKEVSFTIAQEEDTTYYFQVSNGSNEGEIKYTLSGEEFIVFEDIDETTSSNDDSGTAQELTVQDMTITGSGNNSTDPNDYYTMTATEDTTAYVELVDKTATNVKFYLHYENSSYILDGNTTTFSLTANEAYVFRVQAYDTEEQDLSYTVNIHFE
jgi:hypothetical protein